jgi:hypothetical protein
MIIARDGRKRQGVFELIHVVIESASKSTLEISDTLDKGGASEIIPGSSQSSAGGHDGELQSIEPSQRWG